jgi:ABC-type antimicrobial peptide transport system permease subunit
MLHTAGGYNSFILRFVDDSSIPDSSCLLSASATRKLGLSIGEILIVPDANISLRVSAIEPMLTSDLNINNLGIIVLPESTAQTLGFGKESSDFGGLDQQRLFIQISAPQDADDQEKQSLTLRVRSVFPQSPYTFDNRLQIITQDLDELLSNNKAFFTLINAILTGVSLVTVLISALGIILLQRIYTERRKYAYSLLRVNGMTFHGASIFMHLEGTVKSLISAIIGIPIGYIMYNSVSVELIGLAPSIDFGSLSFWGCVLKSFVLIASLSWMCAGSLVRSLFATDIIAIRQRRERRKAEKLWRLMLNAVIYAFVMTSTIGIGSSLEDMAGSLALHLGVMLGAGVLFGSIYGIFRIFIYIIAWVRLYPKNIGLLSIRLISGHKREVSLFASILALGVMMLLIAANVSQGLDLYFIKLWEGELGYGMSIAMQDQTKVDEAMSILDNEGYSYDIIYRKLIYFRKPEKSMYNAKPYSFIAILKDNASSGVHLDATPGSLGVGMSFMKTHLLEIGEGYEIIDNLTLPISHQIESLYETEIVSSFSFSALISYDDAASHVDQTWERILLLSPAGSDIQRLRHLGLKNGWLVITAETYVGTIKTLYANYFSIIAIVGVSLLVVVFVCIVSLTFVDMLGRRREFLVYRIFGASTAQIRKLCIIENAWKALLTAIVVLGGLALLFTQMFRFLSYNIPYTAPWWISLGAPLVVIICVSSVTLIVSRIFDYGRMVDVLRME